MIVFQKCLFDLIGKYVVLNKTTSSHSTYSWIEGRLFVSGVGVFPEVCREKHDGLPYSSTKLLMKVGNVICLRVLNLID